MGVAVFFRLAPALCRIGACSLLIVAGCAKSQSDTVFADDFESGDLSAWQDGVDARHRVLSDPRFARSGSRYLEVTYSAGGDGGWLTRWFMPGYDSLFVSYYVRFEPEWSGGTKLLALYGSRTDDRWSAFGKAGTCPRGDDFFAAMLVTELTGDPGLTRFYSYYPAMAREPDGKCWGRYGGGDNTSYTEPLAMSRGEWHHVELWVKLNAPGQSDGSERFWVDGKERGAWNGLSFRNTADLRLNAIQLSFNRGVTGGPRAQKLYVDDLIVTPSPRHAEPL